MRFGRFWPARLARAVSIATIDHLGYRHRFAYMADHDTHLRLQNVSSGRLRLDSVLLPLKVVWWTVTFQLSRRMQLRREWRLIAQSNAFDPGFYVAQNPDVARAEIDPLQHYLMRGAAEGRNPHPLFDASWYLQRNPDVASVGANPLVHYLSTGWKEGRSPHPLFDTKYYLDQNPPLVAGTTDPLSHYICEGAEAGSDPCELFDSSFYLDRYPHFVKAGLNPLVHYVLHGVIEGCNPNPLFDTLYYLKRYPDVAAAGINPLLHFVSCGASEGRMPNPLFDPLFYCKNSPELRQAKINPLAHYLKRGGADKGYDPGPLFNTARYLCKHPELKHSGVNPLAHLLESREQFSPKNLPRPLTSTAGNLKSTTGSNTDLLVNLTSYELPVIREAIACLCSPEGLRKVISRGTILLPPEIVPVDTPIPAGWCLVPAPSPIVSSNEALLNASEAGHHLLILLGAVLPGNTELGALTHAFKSDPHFGITMGRELEPDSGRILELNNELRDRERVSMPRDVLACVPEFYILPEMLAPCFVVRDQIVANLGLLNECYETLAGALLDYLCRARRCGFRCVVLNQVLIPNPLAIEADTLDRDILKLATEHPSIAQAKVEFTEHPLHLHENLLAHAVSPCRSVRRSLLVDTRGLSTMINGTSEAVLGLCDGFLQASHDWTITLLATAGPSQFHKLAERYPNWEIISSGDRRYFTAALMPRQPWSISGMIELHHMALFNFYTMLDTIAWDIFPASTDLEAAWSFLSEYADGIFYISQYTRDHFAMRFPLSRAVPGCIAYLSFNPADYRRPSDENDLGDDDEFILVVGNSYDHKHLLPTIDLLTSAFPLQTKKVLGLKAHPSSSVEAVDSGQIPQSEIDRLFARARIVVYPSFYEGFGLPILRGLSYGRTVVARHSELLLEIAGRYRGPGRLVAFRNPTELVQVIESILRGGEVAELSLGIALHSTEEPSGWKETAASVLQFIEQQTKNVDKSRWSDRERVIRQLTASDTCERPASLTPHFS